MSGAVFGYGCFSGAALVGSLWADGVLAACLAIAAVVLWALGFWGARYLDTREEGAADG